MQAVILAGGQGTRLRPLTLECPKPLVPLLNTPCLHYQIGLLRQHGVREIVLSCGERWERVQAALGDGDALGVRLRYAVEPEPLGTGGGLRNAAELVDGRVIVLNGDVLTDMDLTAMARAHAERQAQATLALITVENPGQYGIVETDPNGRVSRFLEKPAPAESTARTVNAGAYIFEREVLDLIPRGRAVSIERESFPLLLAENLPVLGWSADGYWLDIGTPQNYRQAHRDLLSGALRTPVSPPGIQRGRNWIGEGAVIDPDAVLSGPALLGRDVRLGPGARVGPFSVLGDGCVVEAGSVVEGSVLWEDVRVGAGATLRDSVVATGCRIGARSRVGPGVVLGPGAIPDSSQLTA